MYRPTPESESTERTHAYLRLALVPGLGVRGAARILKTIKDPRRVNELSKKHLAELGLKSDVIRLLRSACSLERAEAEWVRAASVGIRIVDLDSGTYPALLREIPDPPLILYVRGQLPTGRPHIAIVGSRRPSAYGVNCATRISSDLAGGGVVVVSGLARGIDTAAHRGALAEGATVAVLGTGVDRIYPSENGPLAESIAERGAIVSEFPLGTLPLPHNFPRRNRILAGLALGTLVVEAAERSGSLITARFALEANREVFAVPGPIHSLMSHGCHQLIQQGACLVTGWADIARELSPHVIVTRQTSGDLGSGPGLTPSQRRVLDAISPSAEISLDALSLATSTPAPELYSAVLELELRGYIRKLPGDRYIRNDPPRH